MSDFEWRDIDIFIAAPREMSHPRLVEIAKRYLRKGNIVIGISSEPYVVGFENQVQFAMLRKDVAQPVVDAVSESSSRNKIYIFEYAQKDLVEVLKNLQSSQRVLLVNGSWKYVFHKHPASQLLKQKNIPYKFISPFIDEREAIDYLDAHNPGTVLAKSGDKMTVEKLQDVADTVATYSFDYSFQTGTVLARYDQGYYVYLESACNEVIPYQTYALHFGNSRELHESQTHDANHYDTIHAEMRLLTKALEQKLSLEGATLFVNLLPCPNCARTLSQTQIETILYRYDHSNGYAKTILEKCGKKVQQLPKAYAI